MNTRQLASDILTITKGWGTGKLCGGIRQNSGRVCTFWGPGVAKHALANDRMPWLIIATPLENLIRNPTNCRIRFANKIRFANQPPATHIRFAKTLTNVNVRQDSEPSRAVASGCVCKRVNVTFSGIEGLANLTLFGHINKR